MIRLGFLAVLVLFLNACAFIREQPTESYQLALMRHLQKQNNWYFEGRVAMVDERDSISASINWRHQSERDDIELAGPLAQGKFAITVEAGRVIVDDGENPREYSGEVDAVVSKQLGVDMPVKALKFWVLGVDDPSQSFIEQEGGFIQGGWLVRFREMQRVNDELLPKKISVEKDKTRIKLIVDHWDLS